MLRSLRYKYIRAARIRRRKRDQGFFCRVQKTGKVKRGAIRESRRGHEKDTPPIRRMHAISAARLVRHASSMCPVLFSRRSGARKLAFPSESARLIQSLVRANANRSKIARYILISRCKNSERKSSRGSRLLTFVETFMRFLVSDAIDLDSF